MLTKSIQNATGVQFLESLLFSECGLTYYQLFILLRKGDWLTDNMTMRVGDFVVPLWGEGHNLYPQEVFSVTSENKLLPEVIKKQVKYLFGKGPRLYKEVIQGEGEKQRRVRVPVEDPEIQEALDRWEDLGYDHYWDYLKNLITDYYYVNTCVSRYHFSKARRLVGQMPKGITRPLAALSYIGSDEARLATKTDSLTKRITNKDCGYVIVGDWMQPNRYDYEVYNRLDKSDPFK